MAEMPFTTLGGRVEPVALTADVILVPATCSWTVELELGLTKSERDVPPEPPASRNVQPARLIVPLPPSCNPAILPWLRAPPVFS